MVWLNFDGLGSNLHLNDMKSLVFRAGIEVCGNISFYIHCLQCPQYVTATKAGIQGDYFWCEAAQLISIHYHVCQP